MNKLVKAVVLIGLFAGLALILGLPSPCGNTFCWCKGGW